MIVEGHALHTSRGVGLPLPTVGKGTARYAWGGRAAAPTAGKGKTRYVWGGLAAAHGGEGHGPLRLPILTLLGAFARWRSRLG